MSFLVLMQQNLCKFFFVAVFGSFIARLLAPTPNNSLPLTRSIALCYIYTYIYIYILFSLCVYCTVILPQKGDPQNKRKRSLPHTRTHTHHHHHHHHHHTAAHAATHPHGMQWPTYQHTYNLSNDQGKDVAGPCRYQRC